MATHILVGTFLVKRELKAGAVFYDSVMMEAFGPVLTLGDAITIDELREFAEGFRDFVEEETGSDPRLVPTKRLHKLLVAHLEQLASECDEDAGDAGDAGDDSGVVEGEEDNGEEDDEDDSEGDEPEEGMA